MTEFQSEVISMKEKTYEELQMTRCESLFCRKCVCYFASKSEFSQHIQGHIIETNDGKTSYMRYIERYICSSCGQQFEVRSDLIIHYNTVCLDAPYTCKHCKENCENPPFLQMHLLFHHNYSEEMLRDEGLTDVDENPYLSECSFMKSSRHNAFKSPPLEDSTYSLDNSALPNASSSYLKTRKVAVKRGNLAFNLLNKAHICEMCSESFSRKCVLDIHVQKHALKETKQKRMSRDLSQKSCENNCIPDRKTENSNNSPEITGQHSNSQRAILKPSNVVLGSSVWTKVKPKNKFQGAKPFSYSTRSGMRESKIVDISEDKRKLTNSFKAISRPSNAVSSPATWKKIKLRSRIPNFAAPEQNDVENPKEKMKLGSKIQHDTSLDKKNISETLMKKNKLGNEVEKSPETQRKKIKNISKIKTSAASTDQKDPETSNTAMKSKSSKTKQNKKTPKKEEKHVYICEMCKRQFQDNYKLKRHYLTHTGERPYSCRKCNKSFARDDHMKRHLKKVCSKTNKLTVFL